MTVNATNYDGTVNYTLLQTTDVKNSLSDSSTNLPLSAAQGKKLYENLKPITNAMRFDFSETGYFIMPFYIDPNYSNRNVAVYTTRLKDANGFIQFIGKNGSKPTQACAYFYSTGSDLLITPGGTDTDRWTKYYPSSGNVAVSFELDNWSSGIVICGGRDIKGVDLQAGRKYFAVESDFLPDPLAEFVPIETEPTELEKLKKQQELTDQAVQDLILMTMGGGE